MSVFKVKLNQGDQGTLDINPATGLEFNTSVQRTMYVAGPNGKIREIVDGTTFTDCNYWKQFAVPQVSANDAFIEVLTDDGSVYCSIASVNTYPVVANIALNSGTTFTASGYASRTIDIAGSTGNFASFMQLTNNGIVASGQNVDVKLNGNSGAIFVLEANSTQVFNGGDVAISRVDISTRSGSSVGAFNVEALYSVVSQCNS